MQQSRRLCIVVSSLLLQACSSAHAQDPGAEGVAAFPTKPIRIVVPFPPGGGNDIMGRLVAASLTERLGRQALVDNRPGAAGAIGSDYVAKSPPDGHTLLMISISYAMSPALQKLPFDPVKSFAPVAQIALGPSVLATAPTLPVSSVKQLIALAKARPGQLNYASAGVGGVNHFSGEMFKLMTGTNIAHVPYKGGAQAMTDVIAGQVEILFNALASALPHIRSGRLKPLGVGSLERTPTLPEVPAIAETVPGYEAVIWWGVLAPAGTPRPIVNRLNATIAATLREPATVKRLGADAALPVIVSPEEFGKVVAENIERWKKVGKAAGITAE